MHPLQRSEKENRLALCTSKSLYAIYRAGRSPRDLAYIVIMGTLSGITVLIFFLLCIVFRHTVSFYDHHQAAAVVVFPENLEEISYQAFSGCAGLQEANLPANVVSIDRGAFAACESLTEISVNENNNAYASKDGILYNKDITALICCPAGIAATVQLPDSVRSIGDSILCRIVKICLCHCQFLQTAPLKHSAADMGNAFWKIYRF